MRSDESPDVILDTPYRDIDLNDTPIVVLGCGHFWTIETLDMHVGLQDVYERDPQTGRFVSLIDNLELQAKVPKCPGGCDMPIRQFVTQRYNRLINRAVIAEQSRRFIATGMQELQELESNTDELRDELDGSRKALMTFANITSQTPEARERMMEKNMKELDKDLKDRYMQAIKLANEIKALQKRSSDQHQPANKLHDAITHSVSRKATLDAAMAELNLDTPTAVAKPHLDLRIILGGRLLGLKVACLVLEDRFSVTRSIQVKFLAAAPHIKVPGGPLANQTAQLMKPCKQLVADCVAGNLPKLAVEATLYYARIVHAFGSTGLATDLDRTKAKEYRDTAKDLLEKAKEMCKHSFRDRDTLLEAIVSSENLLRKEFYEEVSAEELKAIKQAMVTGRGGISTHSGHWYNCANGHPVSRLTIPVEAQVANRWQFAIGECGMPMQDARCPECGAPIGGRNHTAVAGVTRAVDMERA
jgi:hypothetical protein